MARRPPPPDDYPPAPGEYTPTDEYPARYWRAREYEEVRGEAVAGDAGVAVALACTLAILLAAGIVIAYFAFRNNNTSATTVTVTAGTGVTTTVTTQLTTTVTTQPKLVNVPSVSGQSQISAIDSVQSGLIPNSYPVSSSQQRGTVVAQSPSSGVSVQQYAQVTIYVGT